ncbi:nostrin [Rhinatrema bivittatum]|uniref:nostrin n=1 Tax=Rhinatrema bivittatum TaxID=194408 RepID=UPI001126698F|nr:nostrin [Rhinatrema bivittatum]
MFLSVPPGSGVFWMSALTVPAAPHRVSGEADLETNYAKGLQKISRKLTKALDSMKKNCIYEAWAIASKEMSSTADLHCKLGTAIQLEAIKPTNQVLAEQKKNKKALDNEVKKRANLVINNWKEQIKAKKNLMDYTKKHEALFHFAQNVKQSVTDKEKQKLLNKLKKSTEILTKADETYYQENIAGHAAHLKWETSLESCYEGIQDLEKERIQLLCSILNRYNQHVSNFGQTLITCQMQIDHAMRQVEVEKDIQTFIQETSLFSEENKAEFLLTDYYEEDVTNRMDKERRIVSMKVKLERVQTDIEKSSRDKEGLEKMLAAYTENPAFSDVKNQDDTIRLLNETNLKLNILEANAFKLSASLAVLEQKAEPTHPCSNYISKWKEKGQEHCSIQIPRPIKTKILEPSLSLMTSNKLLNSQCCPPDSTVNVRGVTEVTKVRQSLKKDNSETKGISKELNGTCKVLYNYDAQRDDELGLQKGDLLVIDSKNDDGWWCGTLKGKRGYFPATYVEELPSQRDMSSQA